MDFGLVKTAFAAENIDTLIGKIEKFIINPAIGFIFALALAYFLYGLVQFIFYKEKGAFTREDGRRHMLWGVVGMAIMLSAFSIINFINNSIQ